MRKFSIIIPVYNRPQEVKELLESLTKQSYKYFEIIVIEDGSQVPCKEVVDQFRSILDIDYYFKENSGQGFSRNFGFKRAKGDYFLVFDSDCLIPPDYLSILNFHLENNYLDAYGGPDKAHPSFNALQKAISYSMTSFFTTGGIRGRKKHAGVFHPRSFNMGISREVFEKTGGYIITRMGEDIEFSIRISRSGFKIGLIEDAFVYHKRRTDLLQFFKQLHFFGRARINIYRFFPSELKPVHFLPAIFLLGLITYLLTFFFWKDFFEIASAFVLLYFSLILLDAAISNNSLKVGVLSIATAIVQLSAYGIGFISEMVTLNQKPK
ncbi:MAG: glycosyltransferase [Bacteroidota bacterium]|nr:glycosyltransferase [Bacteroidota bacterium]